MSHMVLGECSILPIGTLMRILSPLIDEWAGCLLISSSRTGLGPGVSVSGDGVARRCRGCIAGVLSATARVASQKAVHYTKRASRLQEETEAVVQLKVKSYKTRELHMFSLHRFTPRALLACCS